MPMFRPRTMMMQAEGAGGGAAGAAGAEGAAGASAAGAGKAATTDGSAGGAPADKGGDLAARLAAAEAKLAERDALEAKAKLEAEQAAEAARVAALTAEQKRDEELQSLRDRVNSQDAALVATRREAALDKLGLPAKYRAFAPQGDPSTVEGAKALEAFAREHPELLSSSTSQPQSLLGRAIAAGESNLAKVLKGERKSTLVTEASIARLR